MHQPALVGALLAVSVLASSSSARAENPPKPVSFRAEVAPILVRACLGCHDQQKHEGGLDLSTFSALKRGGKSAKESIVVAGDPDSSELVALLAPDAEPRMPYKLPPLPDHQVKLLERWVREGATFDGPSESETSIRTLVDPLKLLPVPEKRAAGSDPVVALAFAPDGQHVASASGETIRIFEAASGKLQASLPNQGGVVTSLRFPPDGKTLIAAGGRAGQYGQLTIWDFSAQRRTFDRKGHADLIQALALSPDGRLAATASYDRMIKLWSLPEGVEKSTLKEHTDSVHALAISPDGTRLASAGADRTVKVWDLATNQRIKTLSEASAELYAVTFSQDGKLLLAAGVDRSIHVWRADSAAFPRIRSVFAHDGPVVRLKLTDDGTTLISSSEDRSIKLWDFPKLEARRVIGGLPDWPLAIVANPESTQLAIGRFDGSIALHDLRDGKEIRSLAQSSASPPAPVKAELARSATLTSIAPKSAVVGARTKFVLNGNGVGLAFELILPDAGLSGRIVPPAKPNPNQLVVELEVASDARPGIKRIGVITPNGVPAFQTFLVSAYPEIVEAKASDSPLCPLPSTFKGVIASPGEVDTFRFQARAGEVYRFESQSGAIGSPIMALLGLEDEQGNQLAESWPGEGASDPILRFKATRDQVLALKVTDANYMGAPGRVYQVVGGILPDLTDVFPLGVERGQTASISLSGENLEGVDRVEARCAKDAEIGSRITLPIPLKHGSLLNARSVVVGVGKQTVESAANDETSHPEPIETPGGVSARIEHAGDLDHFRFKARKGKRLVVELFGRRLGTRIDSVIEILDSAGRPVPRAVLRPRDQTEVAFRDHDASKPGIRLTHWETFSTGDYVLIGRELTRIQALPRNADDDCQFWSERGKRVGFLGTTPEYHPMTQPVYKVTIHPPGSVFPPGGVPPVEIMYRNDDGGPETASDSLLVFDPPADGDYLVRVEEASGQGGLEYGYHLLVHPPEPRFHLTLSTENPAIPRGGTTLVTASIARLDGFTGAVDLSVHDLPSGVTATDARIEPEAYTASFALTADPAASAFSPPTWKVRGRAVEPSKPRISRARSDPPSGPLFTQEVDPGGVNGGWIVVSAPPNLTIDAAPRSLEIRPGQVTTLHLKVERSPAFQGRVPIEIRNLPRGMRILDIGLNGVLLPPRETDRLVKLYAEPWVQSGTSWIYAVGKAEAASAEHSSLPLSLTISQ